MPAIAPELNSNQWYKGWRKIPLSLRDDQKEIIEPYFYAFKIVYNWAMERHSTICRYFDIGVCPSKSTYYTLTKDFKTFVRQPENQYLMELDINTLNQAIREAVMDYDIHGEHYRTREDYLKKDMLSYRPRPDRTYIIDNMIRIPGLKFKDMIQINYHTRLQKKDKIFNPCIFKDVNGNYFLSFTTIENVIPFNKTKTSPIGIDLGIINTFTTSIRINGSYYHQLPEEVYKIDDEISILRSKIDRDINRRKKDSIKHGTKFEDEPITNGEQKREARLKYLYKRKHNIIEDFENRMINTIVMLNPMWVCMEEFHKKKLYAEQKYVDTRMNNLHTYEIREKMRHKCEQHGIPYYEVNNKIFATSKKCSNCGLEHNVGLSRDFICPYCGFAMERDLNASINIAKFPEIEMRKKSKQDLIRLKNTIRPVTAKDILDKEYLALRVMAVKVDNSKPR